MESTNGRLGCELSIELRLSLHIGVTTLNRWGYSLMVLVTHSCLKSSSGTPASGFLNSVDVTDGVRGSSSPQTNPRKYLGSRNALFHSFSLSSLPFIPFRTRGPAVISRTPVADIPETAVGGLGARVEPSANLRIAFLSSGLPCSIA